MFVYLTETHKMDGLTESNAIRISFDYWKGRGFQLLFTGCVHKKEDPDGQFSFWPMSSPSKNHTWEAATRNSEKKQKAFWQEITTQIRKKSGRAWDLLSDFAKEYGMKIE